MRAVALCLVLLLGACADTSVLIGGTSITATVQNPVTLDRLAKIENTFAAAMAGLVEYRRLCIAGVIPATCRDTILKIQPYTKEARVVLVNLRGFVRNNQQISAITAFNTLTVLISNIQAARVQ